MAEIHVNPTRMELKKLKTRLLTARRGHKLLKDKRDELMKQFLEVVRENRDLREKAEESLRSAYASFSAAAAVNHPAMIREALLLPKTERTLRYSSTNMMSVEVPVFSVDTSGDGDNDCFGFAFTSGGLDSAIARISELAPDMIRLAQLEKTAQLLAEEIEKTRRRVNALEHIMIPRYERAIKSISMKLDESDRSSRTRLMKVKDMMLKKKLEGARPDDTLFDGEENAV
ncbi:MAG: V-type ATP synthase subunit D [Clostridia bacterium]|nr:V-type ATP synthase subunit D [Clostridia bacterium]MBR6794929.1 V-type ATP synthase subunit D [Clostridia bacterium]